MEKLDIRDAIKNELNTPYDIDFAILNERLFLIRDVTEIILGVIAYSLAVLMTLITAIDLCYINIPILRAKMQDWGLDKPKYKHLRAVSKDAVKAVEKVETEGIYKSAMSVYAISRMKTYLISAVVLVILLGGTRYISNIVIKILSYIIN